MTTTTSAGISKLKLILALLEADTIKDLGPVVVGAIQTAEKTPGALGLVNAKLYVLGNAPPALLQEEQDFLGQVVTSVQTDLASVSTQLNATIASATATAAAIPGAASTTAHATP